ncbi:hypothetical protein GQR36_25090 [Enterococcus termitis]
MADGSIVISVDVDGKGVTILNDQLDKLAATVQKLQVVLKTLSLPLG